MTKHHYRVSALVLIAATAAVSAPAFAEDTPHTVLFDPIPLRDRETENFRPVASNQEVAQASGMQTPEANTAEEGTTTEPATPLTAEAINQASFDGGALPDGQSALTARIQILLDRGGVSPGVIDGYAGENVDKAISAFEEINGMEVDGVMDDQVWQALQAYGEAPLKAYTITPEDLADISGPLPEDYAELAEREWLGYATVGEKLAEMFHMDIEFLQQLNPGASFETAGTTIMAADPGVAAETSVARLVADKSRSRLLGYDESGRLVLSYPVTIGSEDTPSPAGDHTVVGVATDPTYSYRPGENFQQGDNTAQLTLPPGPNGPVGSTWIDLSEPTYGIHGTPEPAKIGKTSSHGCVRMTNWDASELSHLVPNGATVAFVD